jgi:hypothetical protein
MRLTADDIRELVEFIRFRTQQKVWVTDADGQHCDLAEMASLSKHKLSRLTIHANPTREQEAEGKGVRMWVSLVRQGESVVAFDEEYGRPESLVEEVCLQILKLARAKQDLRILFLVLFALYVLALVGLPTWYVVANGADVRLIIPGALAIAAAIYVGALAMMQLANRVFLLRSGVLIDPISRTELRERRWKTKRDFWATGGGFVLGGVVVAVVSYLLSS